MSRSKWAFGFLGLVACSSPTASSSSAPVDVSPRSAEPVSSGVASAPATTSTPRTPIAPPSGTAAPGTDQWACSAKPDCIQTCALGAVSVAWLKANPNADTCDDGCGWKSSDVTCKEGQCVTVNPDGSVDKGCSFRPYPPPKR